MRLIDADAFKELVKGDSTINDTLCRMIDEQKTAYDVDKVVGRLQDLMYNKSSCEGAVWIRKVIEIVKDGGVNEKEN